MERRGRRLLKGGDDEDIPTDNTSPTLHEEQANEIRIGPITRARAKLLEQQVNSLLIESDVLLNENYILPKSLYMCVIRYQGIIQEEDKGQGQAARGEEPREGEEKANLLKESDVQTSSRTVQAPSQTSELQVGPSRKRTRGSVGINGQVGPSGLKVGPSDLSPDRPDCKSDRPKKGTRHQ